MKVTPNTPGNNSGKTSDGPKLRNINHVENEVIEETPSGIDWKFKAAVIVLALLTIGTYVKGNIKVGNLTNELEGLNKQLTEIQAEALLLGITEDEDGDIVMPDTETPVDVAELDWDSIETRNNDLLKSFVKTIFNWSGVTGYDKARSELMDVWGFTADSDLLSRYMPDISDDKSAQEGIDGTKISCKPDQNVQQFVLSNDGKNMTYFLICEVYNTLTTDNGTSSVIGTNSVRISINEDGTISNVSVQQLVQKKPKK